jgi:hypothetical protein
MSIYADSSLLISYYVTDSHSLNAQAVIHATNEPLPFTGLHHLESVRVEVISVPAGDRRHQTAGICAIPDTKMRRLLRFSR